MNDMAQTFQSCLNQETLETPSARKERGQEDDLQEYKMNYTRYWYSKLLFKILLPTNGWILTMHYAMIQLLTTFTFYRWLCYCRVPKFCDSFTLHLTTKAFSRVLLRAVFPTVRRNVLESFRTERHNVPADKRTIILTHFPKYVYQFCLHAILVSFKRNVNYHVKSIGPF